MGYNNYAHQYDPFDRIPSTDLPESIESDIDVDISERKTEKLGSREQMQAKQEKPQYTYGYEEFENRALFKRVLKNILSPGPYSTMAAIIDMRTIDFDQYTYIGVRAIAEQSAKSERQVERDLKTLEDKGLLRTFPGQAPVKGIMRAVIRKDFSALYRFAYEYLQWEKSPGFQMYPFSRVGL